MPSSTLAQIDRLSQTIKDFKISSSTVPYYGKELGDVDFTVKMYNNANKETIRIISAVFYQL